LVNKKTITLKEADEKAGKVRKKNAGKFLALNTILPPPKERIGSAGLRGGTNRNGGKTTS
jgi:hypothetical protein